MQHRLGILMQIQIEIEMLCLYIDRAMSSSGTQKVLFSSFPGMACINVQLGADRQALRGVPAGGAPPPMSPRVSFSSDFAVEPPAVQRLPPADPNFEFAAGGESATIDADQLFFKGRLLPLKDSGQRPRGATTLREELIRSPAGNEEWHGRPLRGSPIKWKELLGLKKPHCSFVAVPLPAPAPAKKKQNDKPAQNELISVMDSGEPIKIQSFKVDCMNGRDQNQV
ncbi:hypothetical protein ZIOFF_068372 [Zingiber officinale]|uniref:Uncharacterized protein n=1 Tax=Zingiber officinale TaxID=94328 RepID=A0A8J5ERT5_ZINOF|nr:hypothetical protein ZIOFF_068372 [Zingiber officinale]